MMKQFVNERSLGRVAILDPERNSFYFVSCPASVTKSLPNKQTINID